MTVSRGAGTLHLPEPVPKLLRDLVHERMGLHFEDSRLDTMMEKLEPLVSARDHTSYLDYYYLLKYEPAGEEEWLRVMDAFSVPETYFWREFDQLRAVVEHVVPAWFSGPIRRPLRIWSAACATGEEPYSIALALQEAGWGEHPIEIHASDASNAALQRAKAATYRERSFRVLPVHLRRTYFTAGRDGEGGVLRPEIAARVQFRWANLLEPASYAEMGEFPIVFCRNVFIYFSPEAIGRVADHFSALMPPQGNLFIGASESLLRLTDKFELDEIGGAFVYRRIARA